MLHFARTSRIFFLVGIWIMTSGFHLPCFIICSEETDIQNQYTEQRDKCREYAQLKVDTNLHSDVEGSDQSRKAQLISLFSECMGKNGWVVPSGHDDKEGAPVNTAAPVSPTTPMGQAAAPTAFGQTPTPLPPPPTPAEVSAETQAFLKRSSECAFARQNASTSANAEARAHACDIECAERLRSAPETPRPAACLPANKSSGSENHD